VQTVDFTSRFNFGEALQCSKGALLGRAPRYSYSSASYALSVIGLGTESTWVQSGFSVMFSMAWTALAMRATSGLVYFMFFFPFVLTYNQSF